MTDKKRPTTKPRVLGAPYVPQRFWGADDAYLKFARNAWLRVFDPAADGVEVEIIRRERQIAQEESDVQPQK
jgi:hypothetical protein